MSHLHINIAESIFEFFSAFWQLTNRHFEKLRKIPIFYFEIPKFRKMQLPINFIMLKQKYSPHLDWRFIFPLENFRNNINFFMSHFSNDYLIFPNSDLHLSHQVSVSPALGLTLD